MSRRRPPCLSARRPRWGGGDRLLGRRRLANWDSDDLCGLGLENRLNPLSTSESVMRCNWMDNMNKYYMPKCTPEKPRRAGGTNRENYLNLAAVCSTSLPIWGHDSTPRGNHGGKIRGCTFFDPHSRLVQNSPSMLSNPVDNNLSSVMHSLHVRRRAQVHQQRRAFPWATPRHGLRPRSPSTPSHAAARFRLAPAVLPPSILPPPAWAAHRRFVIMASRGARKPPYVCLLFSAHAPRRPPPVPLPCQPFPLAPRPPRDPSSREGRQGTAARASPPLFLLYVFVCCSGQPLTVASSPCSLSPACPCPPIPSFPRLSCILPVRFHFFRARTLPPFHL